MEQEGDRVKYDVVWVWNGRRWIGQTPDLAAGQTVDELYENAIAKGYEACKGKLSIGAPEGPPGDPTRYSGD